MENLIEKMRLNNKLSNNQTFPYFSFKLNKRKSLNYKSQETVLDFRIRELFKDLKKKLNNSEVLKKFLLRRKKKNSLTINKNKSSEDIVKDSGTSGDSGWEGMSGSSSLSSLIITGNFCTSSPVSEKKFKQFSFHQVDLHDDPLKFVDDNYDENYKEKEIENDLNKFNNDHMKQSTTQFTAGNFIRSKSDSELASELDCDDVAEKIREIIRDDPLRQSYPGMSNTTRRESCHQLLKVLLAQIDAKQQNEKSDINNNTMDSKIINETFDTFDSDFVTLSDSVELSSANRKKSMRDTLLEISSRRIQMYDKQYQQNTSENNYETVRPNNVNNVLSVSKSISVKAENFRDDIDKVMKRFESQKIVEDDEAYTEFNQPCINSPILSSSKLNNCMYLQ
ncbi:hypothetical protein PV327_005496 [Microctonus hyperodae]|uniref:Uncharacterized protein n=1 Tax=Microctonus hyperodae TaxID=165561 RepID=A0AA39G1S1_MICHY|nr:hypothetical protein PV327_005496 [Microctonus hyperodae]